MAAFADPTLTASERGPDSDSRVVDLGAGLNRPNVDDQPPWLNPALAGGKMVAAIPFTP